MGMKILRVSAAAAAVVLGSVPASLADTEPTPDERAFIESMLFAEGFTAWDDIEFDDDGYW